jgi:hypothetical protein
MKIHRLLFLGAALSTPAVAQDSFTIAWATVSGGSGASAAPGEFTLAGSSVGQISAGKPSGEPGEFNISGGYWTFEFEPPPPLNLNLRMQLDGGTVTLTWDDNGPPVVLESSADLQLWEPVDPQPAAPPFIEPEGARRFYRLTPAVR